MPDSRLAAQEMLNKKRRGRWFDRGVKYRCTSPECMDCCTGRRGAGHVWVNADEMKAIARHLGMEFDDFTRAHIRQIEDRFSLLERRNFDCIFLNESGCSVYEVRPTQCRTYPFWKEIMKSEQSWNAEAQHCPGIGEETTVEKSTILKDLALDRNWLDSR